MFLGVSILSFIEVFELFVDFAVIIASLRKEQKNNKIAIVKFDSNKAMFLNFYLNYIFVSKESETSEINEKQAIDIVPSNLENDPNADSIPV